MGRKAARRRLDLMRRRITEQGSQCFYCGCRLYIPTDTPVKQRHWLSRPATWDHLLPRCQGGTRRQENLVLACKPCNTAKGGRTLADLGFRPFLPYGTPAPTNGALVKPTAVPSQALPNSVIDVRTTDPTDPLAETQTVATSEGLEVLRLRIPRGHGRPLPAADAGTLIQCVEGRVELTALGKTQALHEGQLVFLLGHVSSALLALENATVLVTIAARRT